MPRTSAPPVKNGERIQYDTIKIRLYPSPEQAELFEKTFGCCRYIWNQMLLDQQRFYAETGAHFIPTPARYKKEAPFLKEVDNQALTQEHNKLAQAFRAFFKNPAAFGYPQFKRKKDDKDSFTVCNHKVCPTIYTTPDGIRMTKAGIVKAVFPRRPRNGWQLKRVTVEKTRTGKYFCCILYAYPVKEPEPVTPTPDTTIGLKYSAAHFYVADTGAMADPPRWLQRSQDKLTAIQQRLSRMQPGSRNYLEQVQKFRQLHEHIANQRRDYLHKESRRIANAYDAVCVRADDLMDMAKDAPCSGATSSGFGMFREYLRYKLERQGKPLLVIDRYSPTTRTCHECGYISPERIDPRRALWRCPHCGVTLSREINAARNIKQQGLALCQAAQAV